VKSFPVIVLWLSTLVILVAQLQQIVKLAQRKDSSSLSRGSELTNLVASGGLLVYSLYLEDPNLIYSRLLLVILWAIRAWLTIQYEGKVKDK